MLTGSSPVKNDLNLQINDLMFEPPRLYDSVCERKNLSPCNLDYRALEWVLLWEQLCIYETVMKDESVLLIFFQSSTFSLHYTLFTRVQCFYSSTYTHPSLSIDLMSQSVVSQTIRIRSVLMISSRKQKHHTI